MASVLHDFVWYREVTYCGGNMPEKELSERTKAEMSVGARRVQLAGYLSIIHNAIKDGTLAIEGKKVHGPHGGVAAHRVLRIVGTDMTFAWSDAPGWTPPEELIAWLALAEHARIGEQQKKPVNDYVGSGVIGQIMGLGKHGREV